MGNGMNLFDGIQWQTATQTMICTLFGVSLAPSLFRLHSVLVVRIALNFLAARFFSSFYYLFFEDIHIFVLVFLASKATQLNFPCHYTLICP